MSAILILLFFCLAFPIMGLAESQGLNIKKFEDGRVKGIPNAHELNEKQLNIVLKEIGLSDEDIIRIPKELKVAMVKKGGKNVLVKSEYTSEYTYVDPNGKRYEITEHNKERIEEIKKQDLKNISLEINSVRDGKFVMYSWVLYQGKTPNGKEHTYSISTFYQWDAIPWFREKDKLAIAWQSHTTPVAGTADGRHIDFPLSGGSFVYDLPVDVSNLYGTSFTVPMHITAGDSTGIGEQDIRIPVRHTGETATIATKYGHLLIPGGGIGVSIGPLSIDFSSLGHEEWAERVSFIIGSDGVRS